MRTDDSVGDFNHKGAPRSEAAERGRQGTERVFFF